MQAKMDNFSEACSNFSLTISTKKTEVMFQPAPGNQYIEPQITVKMLQAVASFTYLGSTPSRTATFDPEINNRISNASVTFGRLQEKVWERRGIRLEPKLKVYRACRPHHTTLWCRNLDSVQTARKDSQPLPSQMPPQPSAHSLAGQNSQHRGSAAGKSPQHHYHCTQLRWAGHVSRMHDDRIPKQLFYRELCHGKHPVGGQHKCFNDSLKVSLKDLDIN